MARTGYVVLNNKWGSALLEVHIRHRRANDPMREESESFYCLPANEKTPPMQFTYEVNGTPFDYWWIKFTTISGLEYQTSKDNYWSNITDQDDGNVEIRIDPGTCKMYLTYSKSFGSSQSLKKN